MSIREGVIRTQVEKERIKVKHDDIKKRKKQDMQRSFRAKKIHIEG